jgi:penicillin-binding protein 1A
MSVAAKTAAGRARRARRQKPTWWIWTKRGLCAVTLLLLIPSAVIGFIFFGEMGKARDKISNLSTLMDSVQRQPSFIFSADGKPLYQISAEYRKYIPYEEIPKNVRNAILAAEDKRFFTHSGVDYWAVMRILFTNVREQRAAQGGSTLTMQLAKLLYTSSEKSFHRKIADMAMAVTMERQLTKEQILELYANKVYFGAGAYGVQAAADVYFGKDINKLTVGEAALLARCVRRPSDQNPFRNAEKAIENRDVVLAIMRGEGMIDSTEFEKAKAEKYSFKHRANEVSERFHRAQYFTWHVLETLKRDCPDINLADGGYKVYTTLDTTMQSVAEAAVRETVHDHRRQGVTTAAFVAIDRDGKILCEVGGLDFDRNQFNVVTDGYRQPGSSFKPFVYSTAFATGAVSVNDSVSNERFVWPQPGGKPWIPKNSGGHYGGTVSIPTAFKLSMNVPMARVMEKTGPSTVVAYCRSSFGFTSPNITPVPALCLGAGEVTPLEMAQGYSVFMLRGARAKPYCITRIVGPDGQVVKYYQPEITPNALDPNVTDTIDALMRSVVTSGTGTRAGSVPDARGKTGTTSENKDAWFCGYADGVVGIGWIANEVQRKGTSPIYLPMSSRVFGGTVTVEFWTKVMKYAQKRFGHQMGERPSLAEIQGHSSRSSGNVGDETGPVPDDTPIPADDLPPIKPGPGDPQNGTTPPITGPDPTHGPPVPPGTDPGIGPGAGVPGDGGTKTVPDRLPPTGPGTRPPNKPAEEPRQDDMIDVEVCADTGMRASIYCPETVTRRFVRGQQPKRRCTKHGGHP